MKKTSGLLPATVPDMSCCSVPHTPKHNRLMPIVLQFDQIHFVGQSIVLMWEKEYLFPPQVCHCSNSKFCKQWGVWFSFVFHRKNGNRPKHQWSLTGQPVGCSPDPHQFPQLVIQTAVSSRKYEVNEATNNPVVPCIFLCPLQNNQIMCDNDIFNETSLLTSLSFVFCFQVTRHCKMVEGRSIFSCWKASDWYKSPAGTMNACEHNTDQHTTFRTSFANHLYFLRFCPVCVVKLNFSPSKT